jgi:transposase
MNDIILTMKKGSRILSNISNGVGNTGQSNRIKQRMEIAALYQCNISCHHIAWFCGCHPKTVKRWIVRIEIGESISDHFRKGRPPIFTQDICLKIIAFYCQTSPLPGCSTWSLRWAAKYLKEHPERIGYTMSHSTIGRILKMHALRPHLRKYFLQITDPEFFPKMEHIIGLYLNPPEYLFCFDECTGIQAIQRLAPDFPVGSRKIYSREFQYKRNGTTDLLAFLRTQTGDVFSRCTENHNTQTLISVFTEQVELQPADAFLHYICDNYSTHFNDEFCKAVAKLSDIIYTPLKTGKERRDWLQSGNKRITIHFVPFHGSWLNMIEIWFGILSDKCLKNGWFESVDDLAQVIIDFTITWNKHFAHPFNWTYRGEGLHGKVVRRFMRLLQMESPQMEIGFLTKQLVLMKNIAETYWSQVNNKDWQQFMDLINQKEIYISRLIDLSSKEKLKPKSIQALKNLTELLYENLVGHTRKAESA